MSSTSTNVTKGETEEPDQKLMFSPFSSLISSTFWTKFDQLKIDVLKLSEDPVEICGFYSSNDIPDVGPIIAVDNTSFDSNCKSYFGAVKAPGLLIATNTLENFKALDYNDFMRTTAHRLLQDLFTEEGLLRISENPNALSSFFILTYPDLKKCKFLFWFGFPAVVLPSVDVIPVSAQPPQLASEVFSSSFENVQKQLKDSTEIVSKGFFLLEKNSSNGSLITLRSLNQLDQFSLENIWFGFLDTSTMKDTPSWVLRNYLAFIVLRLKLPAESEVKIFAYRPGRSSVDKSCTFSVLVKRTSDVIDTAAVKFVGWERNDKGTFGPKQVDLKMSMDPEKLAETSVDLNLKLMKWRIFPDFDLEMMHKTKCLLLGAGTLGCNVARCLMGWGVRNITFVDNGNVSYSNPVRQSLYFFKDCENGGKPKALTAAENMRLIYPGINTKHAQIMIPMAGHPTSKGTVDQVKKDYDTLVSLIEDCDVMYLLMDTREGRWLPTVLGAKYGKIVINAALGFDSYVVMRHGVHTPASDMNEDRSLGCYYCTDVVAPGDSTKDRTLDQQCTVTRPGVSMIAAALAVELMTSILHHPQKANAPADFSKSDLASPLGFVPHTIRGFLASGEQITPGFQPFDKCTACSKKVLEAINSRGFDFVLDVLNNSSDYLEQLTGLDKLKEENELGEGIIELSDDDEA